MGSEVSSRVAQEAGSSPALPLVDRLVPWAVLPVPLLLAAIAVLWLLDVDRSFESRVLLTLLNFAFVTSTAAVVALLAGRTFVATGTPGTLLLGSGVLLMGATFLVAPLAGAQAPNVTATVHNIGMLATGALSLIGVWLSYRPRAPVRSPGPVLLGTYAGSLAFVAATAYLALEGVTPTFFVQGIGGTPLRQVVLATSIGLFGAAGVLLVLAQGNAKTFRRWYAVGLVLLGIGLLGVLLQETLGSPISWLGRIAQYMGSVYLLVASLTSSTEARRWSLPLEAELREERAQARQLREARAQLARVLDGSNDGFWEWNVRSGQADFSDRWAEMFGYRREELAPNVSTWQGMIHPEDREAARAAQKRIARGELDRYEVERRLRHRDGHWVWVLVRGKVVERDGDGKPVRMAGTYTDISGRKAAEEAVREVKERLSLAIDGSGDGFWDWDVPSGKVKYSRRWCSMLGYDLDELEPDVAAWKQLVHPDDLGPVMAAVEAHLRGETPQYENEHRVRHKDGRWVWILDRGKVVSRDGEGKPLRMAGTHTDVTDRRLAREALRESEGRLAALIEQTPAAIAMFDREMRYLAVSREWAIHHGVVAADVIGRSHYDVYPLVPEEWKAMHRRCMAGSVERSEEDRFPRPDGKFDWVRWEAHPWRDTAGEIGGIVVFAEVTTARRELLEQVAITSRLAAMGTLVAGLAHEINNPLAAEMAGQGLALEVAREAREQLRTRAPFDPAAKARELDGVIEALEDAQEAGQRVAKIVRDMAAFARPDGARSRIRLREVVDDAMRWMPQALQDAADIEVDDRGAPQIQASAVQLAQVVLNLVSNAIRATAPGRRGQVAIRLGTGKAGQATLEVIDKGVGIAPGVLPRIFEPFFTTRPAGEGHGTGLGLAICHSIVVAHGGKINVESEVGRGSTFCVELPAATSGV